LECSASYPQRPRLFTVLIPDSHLGRITSAWNCRWFCPGESLDKDRKLMVYLPAEPLRSFGEARPAGRFQGSVMTFRCESLRTKQSRADKRYSKRRCLSRPSSRDPVVHTIDPPLLAAAMI